MPPPPTFGGPALAGAADAGPDSALAAVLARVAAGDGASRAHLFDLTSARAHQLALTMTRGDQDAAAEVVCAAYRAIWTAAPTWHETRLRPLSWVLSIVRDVGGADAARVA